MKLVSLWTIAHVATITTAGKLTGTHAAECTSDQLATIDTDPIIGKIPQACSGTSTATPAAVLRLCKNQECAQAIAAALEVYPQCEINGKSPFEKAKSIVETCKSGGGSDSGTASATTTTTTAPPSPVATTSSAPSTSTATAVASSSPVPSATSSAACMQRTSAVMAAVATATTTLVLGL